jgi:pimeloyl-ACP methyl ester carboxylesterase
MPSKKSSKTRRSSTPSRAKAQPRLYGPAPKVTFVWLIGAAATAVALGALGAYIVLGVIFYQNQAMLLFHPSRKITTTPASVGLAYQEVTLNPEKNGKYLVTGWWIPAATNGPRRNDTILYLHGASGSLANAVPYLKALHDLGINIFAIDYRGFGNSADVKPTEQSANADAVRAWAYLRDHQKLASRHIVVYGQGAGATFAANLAMQRPVPALILAEISPTAHAVFRQDPRARLLPLFLLANQHLNPAPDLKRLHIPKLFLDWPDKSATKQDTTRQNYQLAAQPRQLTSLPGSAPSGIAGALPPFLTKVLPAAQ